MPSTDNLNYDPAFKLGEISGKLDLLLSEERSYHKHTAGRFDGIEGEVQVLKRDKAWVLGGAAVISLVAPFVLHLMGVTL